MASTSQSEFSNDRPLLSTADDSLNRAPFVERIASAICGFPRGIGLVIGIYGPWGDGKTSVLNMLRARLDKDRATATATFNPWRFTDEASMIAGFFGFLASIIGVKLKTKSESVASTIAEIGQYAGVVDERLGRAGSLAANKAKPGLEELRERISRALGSANKRIVVLMDDIDRLDNQEAHTLFRLIKACADFPNVCYVLAFDDVAVAKSLGERYGSGGEESGRAFLEKIIQVPLKLPLAMKEDLRILCFNQVSLALRWAGITLDKRDEAEFYWSFERSILIRLTTPRAAKRYGNALMFALPMLKGEVRVVDLLLIEALREFYPAIYEIVRARHEEFCGVEPYRPNCVRAEPRAATLLRAAVDALSVEEKEAVNSLLKDLFPRLGSGGVEVDWQSTWATAKRICSPDYCPRYFTYSVHAGDVRDSELDALYAKAAAESNSDFGKAMVAYFAEGKAQRLVERMRHREDSTPPEAVPSLCLAIAANAKYIPNPPSFLESYKPVSQAGLLVANLIERLPAGQSRVSVAKQVIEAADPLWFGEDVTRWLHVTDEASKADRNVLTRAEVDEVRKTLVERIKARAQEGEPLFNVDVGQEKSLLFAWWRVEGREPVQSHLSRVFDKDPKGIAQFLQVMAPSSWRHGDVLPGVGTLEIDQLRNIGLIYDLDDLAVRVREILAVDVDRSRQLARTDRPVAQRLAEEFILAYNAWKQGGEAD